ncbi:hypothetical protein [Thalassovita sp.]|uniref:hypothetical protein n=1 Tax=Thalassovita sp. TaxID=1979401 RepID=UPI002B276653|nr:hypothetical protein [Thalassovita sp.]
MIHVDIFADMTVEELANLDRADRAALQSEAEAERIEAVKARGFVPDEVGPEVPEAPARGPVRMFESVKSYPKGADGFEVKRAGYMGRKTLQRADVFDVMAAKAARHKKSAPFNPSQVAIGRFYRDLVEKHACAGVKCSSLESLSQRGGNGGGEFMDAVLRDRQQIDVLRRRIGDGSALVVRRHRPSTRGSRVPILDRRLVDMVCLEDRAISDVLKAHGWVTDGQSAQGKQITSLSVALAQALDRMMGPVVRSRVQAAQFGVRVGSIWD